MNKPIIGMMPGRRRRLRPRRVPRGMFILRDAPFFGSFGGIPIKNPIVSAAVNPGDNGYWMSDTAGQVSEFGQASYYGLAPAGWRARGGNGRGTGTGAFVGGTYPSGAYGYDVSYAQCGGVRPAASRSASTRSARSTATTGGPNPCLSRGGPGRPWPQSLHLPELPTSSGQHARQQRMPLLSMRGIGRPSGFHHRRRQGRRERRHRLVARRREGPNWTGRPTWRRTPSPSRGPSSPCIRPRASPMSASTPARPSGTPSSATISRVCPTGWPTTSHRRADLARATTTPTG